MYILEHFLDFENENNLFELQYKGEYYWQFIRFEVYSEIIYGENAQNAHPDMENKSIGDKAKFVAFVFGQFKHYFDKQKYDLFVTDAYIRKSIGNRLINPFIQFILEEDTYYTKNNTVFSDNWVKDSTVGSNNALIQALWIPHYFCFKIGKRAKRTNDFILENIIDKLNYQFGCNLSYQKYQNSVQQNVLKFKLIKRYYIHIIKNKYKAIYLISYYDIYNYALVSAARECGIPTVEHQHGVIGKYHISYNFKDSTATGKYLPDYLFTFGDYWSKTCRLPNYVQPISVGSPQMDGSKKEFNECIRDNKTIVFISNGLIGSEMSKFAIRFADMVVPLGYHIIYKFHPNERLTWRDCYPWLSQTVNIEIIDEPINVHSILSSSKHIISVASTVVFEALTFGCNVYIWNRQLSEYVDDFTQMGVAPLFDNESQLYNLIKDSPDTNIAEIADSLYLSDSVENVKIALNKIMEEKQ